MMNEERTKILQMLSDGKITADEAAELLEASVPLSASIPATMNNDNSAVRTSDVAPDVISYTRDARKGKASGLRGRWTNWANNLEGMRCEGANLDGAFFFANNLDSVDLCFADVENAKVCATNLDSAIFEGANLRGARIFCSNLDGANFRNANLEGVFIFGTNFDSANMEGADLRGQSFVATNMDGFNWSSNRGVDVDVTDVAIADGPVAHL